MRKALVAFMSMLTFGSTQALEVSIGDSASVEINDESIDQISKGLSGGALSQDELSRLAASAEVAAELEAQGINVVDTIEEALASGGLDTAVDTANAEVAAAVEQAAQDFVNDPNGVNAEAIADGHDVYVGDPEGAPGNQ